MRSGVAARFRAVSGVLGRSGVVGGRRVSWRSGGVLGVLVVLVVAAFAAEGFRSAKVDLNEAGVWVTNRGTSQVGRLNMQTQKIEVTAKVSRALDVVQDGRRVAVVDPGVALRVVDVATAEADPKSDVALPASSSVGLGGGQVAVTDLGTGSVWVAPFDSVGSIRAVKGAADLAAGDDEAGDKGGPTAELGAGAVVAVGPTGSVVGVDVVKGRVRRIAGAGEGPVSRKLLLDSTAAADGASPLELVVVGSVPVVFDPVALKLQVADRVVDLSSFGSVGRLQAGPATGSRVLVATDRGVVAVPLGDGDPSWVLEEGGAAPIRPVLVRGCAWAAWGGDVDSKLVLALRCGSSAPQRVEPDVPVGAEMVFRVNGPHVALNFPVDGRSLVRVDDEFVTVNEWPEPNPDPDDEQQEEDKDEKGAGEDVCAPDGENALPKPVDDVGEAQFGARPLTATILPVLANDDDGNCDVLTVTKVADVAPPVAEVVPVDRGHAVQFTSTEDHAGPVTFTYWVTDGRSDPVAAKASVVVRAAGEENLVPQQQEVAKVTVAKGQSVTYNVLSSFVDPDGDPLVLTGARPTAGGSVRSQPDGTVVFSDDGTTSGATDVALDVSDGFGVASGTLRVQVVDSLPPVARNDHAVGLVGTPITIEPLVNDASSGTEPLRLAAVDEVPERTTAIPESQSGTVTFTAEVAGSYRFKYTVVAGAEQAQGWVRVDVSDPSPENRPPVAVRDVVTVPAGGTTVVDLLANDTDPDFDVLVVQSVEPPSGAGLTVQLLEQRAVRVSAASALAAPATVTYLVSDGGEPVEGQLVVQTLAGGQLNQPPVARDDVAIVRAGDVVTVPVLANDSDPEGNALKASVDAKPELAFNLSPGASAPGEVFSDGVAVRFVAGPEPTSVSINYSATDEVGAADSGLVRVTVVADDDRNGAPVPRSLEARTLATNPVEIRVPIVGIDPDGDSVTLSLGPPNPAAKGSAELDAGCTCFVYTPADGAVGTDTFTYIATDSRGAAGTATVRVGIAPRAENQPPVAVADTVKIRPDRAVPVAVLANDYDDDRDPIELVSVASWSEDSGVTAEVKGDKVVARGPEGATANFNYVITDGRAPATGTLSVTVTADAPAVPPVANDDDPDACEEVGAAAVTCAVLVNDDDPDGTVDDLTVSVPDRFTTASVSGGKVKVTLGAKPQIITYTITDPDELSATAVLRVPAARGEGTDLPPVAKDGPPIAVELGKTVDVEVGDYATDPERQGVRLGSVDISFPRGTGQAISPTAFRLTPGEGAVGESTVSFQVTDGADSTVGNRVTITVPVTVTGQANTAPSFAPNPVEVAVGDDPTKYDIAGFATDPDPGDELVFSNLSGATGGLDASLDGSTLTLSAGDGLKKGGSLQLTVTVSDGEAEIQGQIPVRIVASTRAKATATLDEREAQSGKEIEIDVLANDVVDPKVGPLKVVDATVAPNLGSITNDDTKVRFTPSAEFVGTADLVYVVNDKLGDDDRKVTGAIRITVKDRPKAPAAPTPAEFGSKYVVLKWDPPDARGQAITKYEVSSQDGSVKKETSGAETQLRLTDADNVRNNVEYRFTVRAYNGFGEGWSDPSPASTEVRPDTRPDRPTVGPQLTYNTSLAGGELLVSWPAVGSPQWRNDGSPVENYRLVVSPPDGVVAERTPGPSVPPPKLTGLRNGVNYTVQVQARNNSVGVQGSDGWSDLSPPSAEMFPATKPNAVARPTATRVDNPLGELIEVTWTRPVHNTRDDDCCDYRIRTTGSSGAPAIADVLVRADRRASITQQVATPKGYTYTFQVFATNKAGEGPASQASVGVASFTRPEVVTGVSATVSGTNDTATLNFTPPNANGDPIDNYLVQVSSPDGGAGTGTRTINGPGTGLGGLTNGRTYTFTVQACNQGTNPAYCSPASASSAPVVPYGPPSAPSVSAGHTGGNNIGLSWNGSGSGNGAPVEAVEISIDGGGWQRVGVAGSTDRNTGCATSHSIAARAISRGLTGPVQSASGAAPACPVPTIRQSFGIASNVFDDQWTSRPAYSTFPAGGTLAEPSLCWVNGIALGSMVGNRWYRFPWAGRTGFSPASDYAEVVPVPPC